MNNDYIIGNNNNDELQAGQNINLTVPASEPEPAPAFEPTPEPAPMPETASTPDVTEPASTPDVTEPASTPDVTEPASTPDVTEPASTPEKNESKWLSFTKGFQPMGGAQNVEQTNPMLLMYPKTKSVYEKLIQNGSSEAEATKAVSDKIAELTTKYGYKRVRDTLGNNDSRNSTVNRLYLNNYIGRVSAAYGMKKDTVQKVFQYAIRHDITPEIFFAHPELIKEHEEEMGTYESAWDAASKQYQLTKANADYNKNMRLLQKKMADGTFTKEDQTKLSELNKWREDWVKYADRTTDGFLQQTFAASGRFLAQNEDALKAAAYTGTISALALATAGIPLIPAAGTALTAPIKILGANLTGGTLTSGLAYTAATIQVFMDTYEQEAAQSTQEMIDAGINPQLAYYFGEGVGIINGAIESGTTENLVKALGAHLLKGAGTSIFYKASEYLKQKGALLFLQDMTEKYGDTFLGKMVAHATGAAAETSQEVTESVVSLMALEAAKASELVQAGTPIKEASKQAGKNIVNNLPDTVISTIKTAFPDFYLGTLIPAAAGAAGTGIRNKSRSYMSHMLVSSQTVQDMTKEQAKLLKIDSPIIEYLSKDDINAYVDAKNAEAKKTGGKQIKIEDVLKFLGGDENSIITVTRKNDTKPTELVVANYKNYTNLKQNDTLFDELTSKNASNEIEGLSENQADQNIIEVADLLNDTDPRQSQALEIAKNTYEQIKNNVSDYDAVAQSALTGRMYLALSNLTDISPKELFDNGAFSLTFKGDVTVGNESDTNINVEDTKSRSDFIRTISDGMLTAYEKLNVADTEVSKSIKAYLGMDGLDLSKPLSKEDQAIYDAAHKKFSDAMEQYIKKGKAPTAELDSLFNGISNAMLQAYNDITDQGSFRIPLPMRATVADVLSNKSKRIIKNAKHTSLGEIALVQNTLANFTNNQVKEEALLREQQKAQSTVKKVADKMKETSVTKVMKILEQARDILDHKNSPRLSREISEAIDSAKTVTDLKDIPLNDKTLAVLLSKFDPDELSRYVTNRKSRLTGLINDLNKTEQKTAAQKKQLKSLTEERDYISDRQKVFKSIKTATEADLKRAQTHVDKLTDMIDRLQEKYQKELEKLKKKNQKELEKANTEKKKSEQRFNNLAELNKTYDRMIRDYRLFRRLIRDKEIAPEHRKMLLQIADKLAVNKSKPSQKALTKTRYIWNKVKNEEEVNWSDLSATERHYLKLADKQTTLDMTVDDFHAIVTQMDAVAKEGKEIYKKIQDERATEYKNIAVKIGNLLEQRYTPHKAKDRKHKGMVEIQNAVTKSTDYGRQYGTGLIGKMQKFGDWVFGYTLQMIRICDWLEGGDGAYNGIVTQLLIDTVNKAHNEELVNTRRRTDHIYQAMEDCSIKTEDLTKKRDITLKTTRNGKEITTYKSLTLDELLSVYIYSKNEQARYHMTHGNFGNLLDDVGNKIESLDGDAFISLCVDRLSMNERRFADALMQDFKDNTDRLAKTYEERMLVSLREQENYFPIRVIGNPQSDQEKVDMSAYLKDVKILGKKGELTEMPKGFLSDREDASSRSIELGAMSTYLRSVNEQEHAAAFGEVATRLKSVLNYKFEDGTTLSQKIEKNFGKTVQRAVLNYTNMNILGHANISDAILDGIYSAIANNASVAYLAFNLATILKQLTPIPRFLISAGPKNLLYSLVEYFAHPREITQMIGELDPQIKDLGANLIDQARRDLKRPEKANMLDKAVQLSMNAIAGTNQIVSTIGWLATYQSNLEHGLSEEEAITKARHAVELTQQTNQLKDLPMFFQQTGWAKLFTLFTTDAANTYGLIVYDMLHGLATGHFSNATKAAFGVALTAVLYGMVTEGGTGDEPWAWWTMRQIRQSALSSLPFIGNMVNAGYSYAIDGVRYQSTDNVVGSAVKSIFTAIKEGRDYFSAPNGSKIRTSKENIRFYTSLISAVGIASGRLPSTSINRIIRGLESGDLLKAMKIFAGIRGYTPQKKSNSNNSISKIYGY